MKKTCIVAVLLGLGLAAEDRRTGCEPAALNGTGTHAGGARSTVRCAAVPETIPAGAKEVEPYTFSYTDAQGNQWMYRRTPFGITKWRSSDVPAPAMKEQPKPVTVTETGDEIRFERTTPFGHNVWTKKKSELTADEKLLVGIAAERK